MEADGGCYADAKLAVLGPARLGRDLSFIIEMLLVNRIPVKPLRAKAEQYRRSIFLLSIGRETSNARARSRFISPPEIRTGYRTVLP